MSLERILQISVILSATDKMTRIINSAVDGATRKLQQLSASAKKIGDQAMGAATTAAGVAASVGAAMALPIKSAMEFETGMTGVRKVVDGLKDEKAFKQFSDEVLALGRELPIAHKEITDLVAAGGRMDIPKEKLIAYTRQVAKMSTAFDMAAGEIGEKMGKLAVAFEIPIDKIDGLADAINYLDDNSISKGADIIETLSRMAGTARQVGMAAPQAAALASTFLTLGSSAEVAGTASNAMLRELAIAKMQPKKFQEALSELGISAESLQKQMTIDPQKTLLGVLDKLNKVKPEKQIEITTKLFGKEYGDDAAKLAKGVNEYRRQIALLEKTELKGSMNREFEARMKTSAAQMQIFKNSLAEIAVTLGNALLPAFNSVLNAVKPYIEQLREWAKRNPELVETIAKVAVTLGAVMLAVSAVSFVFGGLMKVVSLVTGAFSLLTGTMSFITKTAGIMSAVFTKLMPILVATAGIIKTMIAGAFTFLGGVIRSVTAIMWANPILAIIGAIALAAYLIYDNWDGITAFFSGKLEEVKNLFNGILQWFDDVANGRWYDAGVSLVSALWEGIKSLYTGLWDYVTAPVFYVTDLLGITTPEAATLNMQQALAADKFLGTNTAGALSNQQSAVSSFIGAPMPKPNAATGGTASNMLNFNPTVTITGNPSPEQIKETEGFFNQFKDKMFREFNEMTRQKERKAY